MKLLAAFATIATLAAAPAGAVIVLGTGSGVVQPNENVLFNNNPPNGLQILGITNQTASFVRLNAGETLVGNGGQARAEPLDGALSTAFTYMGTAGQLLGFDLLNTTLAFTQAEFRVFGGTATSLTLTAFDTTGGQFAQTFTIPSNGFFFLNTMDNQLIDRFSIAANGTIGDIRQIRVGGVATIPVVDPRGIVPEPASWALMILGFGGMGALMRRRRAVVA